MVVLESTNPPDGTTRYIDQVVTDADPRFDFRYLSPTTLFRRSDVFHVHWPEVLVRGRGTVGTALRCVVLLAAIGLMRLRRTAVVRTLHNVTPHEPGGRLERRTLALLDDATDLYVRINPVTQAPREPSVLVLHGHYRERFANLPQRESTPGRLVYAGMIRPYKGVEQLLRAFAGLADTDLELRLVGQPTPALRSSIEDATAADRRITSMFGFVPDQVLVEEVTSASLVCLPYEELHNSGMLIVALSLDRPVLVPDTATTRALADEVGPTWVRRFRGELTSAVLANAVDEVRRRPPTGRPTLGRRDWQAVADGYGAAFDAAVRARRSS